MILLSGIKAVIFIKNFILYRSRVTYPLKSLFRRSQTVYVYLEKHDEISLRILRLLDGSCTSKRVTRFYVKRHVNYVALIEPGGIAGKHRTHVLSDLAY